MNWTLKNTWADAMNSPGDHGATVNWTLKTWAPFKYIYIHTILRWRIFGVPLRYITYEGGILLEILPDLVTKPTALTNIFVEHNQPQKIIPETLLYHKF